MQCKSINRFRRTRARAQLALSLLLAISAHGAAAPVITASALVGGGGRSVSPGQCFTLDATVGQPTAGSSMGGSFILDAGFLPGNGDQESIFHHGFEACT
jgi:hypothetical protein